MIEKKILKEILISANEGLTIFDYYNENINTNIMTFNELKEIFVYYLKKDIFNLYYKNRKLDLLDSIKIIGDKTTWFDILSNYNVVLSKKGLDYLNKKEYTQDEEKILFPNFR